MPKVADAWVDYDGRTGKFDLAMGHVQKSLGGFGKLALRIGGTVAAAFAVRGIARFAASSVRAFGEQQAAEKRLADTLASHGDAIDRIMPKMRGFAEAIQQQTTYGDEQVMALAATLRNLGVAPDKMQQATKGAIGLAKALNMDGEAAARYTALALQGDYTILQRYVPALRTATSEAEKQAIVLGLMERGFAQAQGETETMAGKQKQLANAWGDFKEAIGESIMNLIDLPGIMSSVTGMLQKMRGWIERNGESFIRFSENMKRAMKMAKMLVTTLPKNWAEESAKIEAATNRNIEARIAAYRKQHEKSNEAITDAGDEAAAVEEAEKEKQAAKKETMNIYSSFADIMRRTQELNVGPPQGAEEGARNATTAMLLANRGKADETEIAQRLRGELPQGLPRLREENTGLLKEQVRLLAELVRKTAPPLPAMG